MRVPPRFRPRRTRICIDSDEFVHRMASRRSASDSPEPQTVTPRLAPRVQIHSRPPGPRFSPGSRTVPSKPRRRFSGDCKAERPGVFPDHQLRTLQRRVRQWRMQRARRLVFGVQNGATAAGLTPLTHALITDNPAATCSSNGCTLWRCRKQFRWRDQKFFCRIRGRLHGGVNHNYEGKNRELRGNILAEATR